MADGVINPMRVDTSLLHGIAAANNAAAQAKPSTLKSSGTTTSFSSALKSASDKETTKAVEGQNYAEIVTGPRAGMYLNTGGGPRDGQAFILVKHDGREDHIYGTGKDRVVISSGTDKADKSSDTSASTADDTAATGARKGERTKAVDGHAYADILNGSRSGMYINTSGNKRDGDAFVLVKRNGREFHIYGTGKDRVVVGLKPKADDTSTKTDTTSGTSTTDTSTTTDTTSTTGTDTTTKPGNSVVDDS
jgi:hypothetical protein